MNNNEFKRIWAEFLMFQEKHIFASIEELKKYLFNFSKPEIYLRNAYRQGVKLPCMWDFQNEIQNEANFFSNKLRGDINLVKHSRYDIHVEHTHEYFQVDYCFSGKGTLFLCNTPHDLHDGDICIISPGTSHHLEVFSDSCIIIELNIKKSTFEKSFAFWLSENNALSIFFRQCLYYNKSGNYLFFNTKKDENIKYYFLELFFEWFNGREYSRTISQCLLSRLFCYLLREYMDTLYTEKQDDTTQKIGILLKYIRDNYRTITLEALANEYGYSKNYLCKLIKESTGKTFVQIVNDFKIDVASQMLSYTDLPIKDISENVGFNNIEHFYRIFKRIKRTSPSSYKKIINIA